VSPTAITLGTGRLDWPNVERAMDTYFVVTLDAGKPGAGTGVGAHFAPLVRFDETMHGQRGTLTAQVIAPHPEESFHAHPATAGELVELGPGHAPSTPWTSPDPSTEAPVLIGVLPDGVLADHEPRMDVDALYRVASATVILLFRPGAALSRHDVTDAGRGRLGGPDAAGE
jgi:hypothetical protein